MLNLVLSNSLQELAASLSQFLTKLYANESDLQARSAIVVQSETMASYVRREMALNIGVCANLEFYNGIQALFESWCMKTDTNGGVWTENYLFSVLYPYFLEKLDAEIAISRARTHAQRLLRLGYENPSILKQRSFNDSTHLEDFKQLLQSFAHVKSTGGHITLPYEWLDAWKNHNIQLPESIYIFDPAPLSQFERDWLKHLSQKTDIFVFAFRPCHSEDAIFNYKTNGDEGLICSSEKNSENHDENAENHDDSKLSERTHFLLKRCGKISKHCLVDLQDYQKPMRENYFPSAFDADIQKYYDEHLGDDTPPPQKQLNMLQSLQFAAWSFPLEHEVSTQDCKCDDSIQILGFANARDEVQWIRKQITKVCDASRDISLESVVVLVPQNVLEAYGTLIRAEFIRHKIPHNIHALISQPLEVCYSAFAAFVSFLCDEATRKSVLNLAFHEGITDDSSLFERFTQVVDQLGIYSGLDKQTRHEHGGSSYLSESDSFTWADGLSRLAASCLHTPETSGCQALQSFEQGDYLDILRCWQRIRVMLEDHRTVRTQCLSYSQWREFIYGLFDTWLRADVINRETAMDRLWQLFVSKWPSDHENGASYSFHTVMPLLRALSRQLENEESGRITGGVQIRPLTCDVFTSDYVFICGLTQENFPSLTSFKRHYSYSQEDIDAHAWLRWFHNVRHGLYLTAALPDIQCISAEDPHESCVDLAHFSVFVSDLAKHLNITSAKLYIPQTDHRLRETLSDIRYAWYLENHRWPMRLSDFDEHIKPSISNVLNQGFSPSSQASDDSHSCSKSDIPNTCKKNAAVDSREPNIGQHPAKQLSLFGDLQAKQGILFKESQIKQQSLVNNHRNVGSCQHQNAATDSHTSSANSVIEKNVDWHALSEMILDPYKAYRKYYLKIASCFQDTPQIKARLTAEPIESASHHYGMRKAIDDLVQFSVAKGIYDIEKLTTYYNDLMSLFKASGLYPDELYGEIQQAYDLRMLKAFSKAMTKNKPVKSCTSPVIYRLKHTKTHYTLVDHWFLKKFDVNVIEIPSPGFDVPGPDSQPLHIRLTGDLPLLSGNSFVYANSKASIQNSLSSGIAVCLMVWAGIEPPNQSLTILLEEKNIIETLDLKSPDFDVNHNLEHLCKVFASGCHEIRFAHNKNQLPELNADKLKQTPLLYGYLGDNKAYDALSFEYWQSVFKSQEFLDFTTLCGLQKNR